MTSVGLRWHRREAGRSAATQRAGRTAGQLLARLGRVALWLAVAVLMVRGLAGTLAADRPTAAPSRAVPVAVWPDDAARAFAVEFATAYLTHSPTDDAGTYASAPEAFASPELVSELAPRFDADAPRQAVRSALVAGAVRLDGRHALVTVAATLRGAGLARRFITVPIARDGRGGLVVDDLPSFTSAPPRGGGHAGRGAVVWR
jgi:hypothetical protein